MKHRATRHANRSKRGTRASSRRSKTQWGGRTENVISPVIKYTKSETSPATKLACTKCSGSKFIVKTMTMGTKTKSFFAAEILNNRFKMFQCAQCGFVQMYSNSITCDGKSCDPLF